MKQTYCLLVAMIMAINFLPAQTFDQTYSASIGPTAFRQPVETPTGFTFKACVNSAFNYVNIAKNGTFQGNSSFYTGSCESSLQLRTANNQFIKLENPSLGVLRLTRYDEAQGLVLNTRDIVDTSNSIKYLIQLFGDGTVGIVAMNYIVGTFANGTTTVGFRLTLLHTTVDGVLLSHTHLSSASRPVGINADVVSIKAASDGNIIIAANLRDFNALPSTTEDAFYFIKFNNQGQKLWEVREKGRRMSIFSFQPTFDGGCVASLDKATNDPLNAACTVTDKYVLWLNGSGATRATYVYPPNQIGVTATGGCAVYGVAQKGAGVSVDGNIFIAYTCPSVSDSLHLEKVIPTTGQTIWKKLLAPSVPFELFETSRRQLLVAGARGGSGWVFATDSLASTVVVPSQNCQKYAATQTNSICNPATYQPFFLKNGTENYVADGVELKETSAGTATLTGTLRTSAWQAVPIDLTFSGKTTTGTPTRINCLDPSVSAANWAY
jgi:hypothetical protein